MLGICLFVYIFAASYSDNLSNENSVIPESFAQVEFVQKNQIDLGSRNFVLVPQINLESIVANKNPEESIHYLLQFEKIPNWQEKQKLAEQGIHLLNYVTENTYIASTKYSQLQELEKIPGIEWGGQLVSEDKLSVYVKTEKPPLWAVLEDGQVVYTIIFHKDVSIDQAKEVIILNNGKIFSIIRSVPSIVVSFVQQDILNLVKEDAVQFVDYVELPLEDHNDNARVNVNVPPLLVNPYNLNGNGVTVMVYDSGIIDNNHPDFAGRVLQLDPDTTETIRLHSTHVAGTVGGSGANSNGFDSAGNPNGGTQNQWAGMAPGVNFRSFGGVGGANAMYFGSADLNNDVVTAITNGVDLATMSQGNNVVRNGFPCNRLGDYSNTAILIDNIVTGNVATQQLIFFESAGNEQRVPPAGCNLNFGTISSPATAKNSIVLGSINSDDNTLAGSSSRGPTDDGRLKPDIVAPGCQNSGDFTITSTGFNDLDPDGPGPVRPNGNLDAGEVTNTYSGMCGTSMATPVAAGSGSLIIQQWKSTRGQNSLPFPHTMKAILIHTTTDLGNAGPDYQFGWGALNAQAGVDLVIADDTEDLIHVDQVDNGQVDSFEIVSDGVNPIEVTLVWDDPAATALAANTLVNDLDLLLTDPNGNIYQPFVLNAAVPAAIATTGIDSTNNVEVIVSIAGIAGEWQVTVTGTIVPQGPQQYTLITSEGTTTPSRCVPNFAYGVYPTFYTTIHQIPEAQYAQFINANFQIAYATNFQLVKYINCMKIVPLPIPEFEFPPICVEFGDPFDFPPSGPIIGKCPPVNPCPFGIQCPDPFENIRAEVPTFVLRDVGRWINDEITLNQFNDNLKDLVKSDQIKITTPEPLTQTINLGGTDFNVDYFIQGGTLLGINADVNLKSLITKISSADEGELIIKLPRELIDAKSDSIDDQFIVSVDGVKKDFEETSHSSYRALKIPFSATAEEIQVTGNFIAQEPIPIFLLIALAILVLVIVSVIVILKRRR